MPRTAELCIVRTRERVAAVGAEVPVRGTATATTACRKRGKTDTTAQKNSGEIAPGH